MMKDTKMYRLLFTLLIACTTLTGWGQGASYPVQVMTQLTPPYSLILSDYAKPASQKLFVTIMVRDLNIVNLPVRLHIKMETLSGMTVETIPNIITPAIYLTGGLVTMLYGTDLTDYFNINNLQFKGYSKEDYRRTGQLPEGHYRITVEVRHWATGRIISSQGTAYTWMALGKPPVLKVPEDKAEMGKIPGMPLTFSWIPNKVGIPGVIPQYKFEMWEMRIPGINPNVVAASMPTFYTTTQLITNLVIHPATLNFEPGLEYAWRVTAFDPIGDVSFEQGGHSVIRTFTYQCKCEGVSNVNLERKGQNVAVSWNQIPNKHTSFHLEMENQASGWSATDVVYYNKANSGQLVVGATYRMRVRAICDGNTMNPSEPSAWQTITIPEPPKRDPDSECGVEPKPLPITNAPLRNDLQPGDMLIDPHDGGSRYIVKTATVQSDGRYKGIFLFWWEWAGELKAVCEYWDLAVNTDNQILNMNYKSVYNPAFLLDIDAAKDYIKNLTTAVDNVTNAVADVAAKLTTNTQVKDSVKINAPLKGAYINEDKQLVVVKEKPDGTLEETVQPTGKMAGTLVQGSDGEEYVVTSDGKMMGEKEFNETGGNSRLMNEHNKEKEAKANPSVTFVASSEQKYGFDSYAENKSAIQNEYPELKSGYRPPFKSVESFKTDKVQTNNTDKDVTFRTEMGVPVTESGKTLTVRGSYDGDEQALYAYAGKDETETVVGKLNVLSFDTKKKKVYLVSVNNANLPNAMTLQQELNRIYAPAVVSWAVQNAKAVSVTFAKGKMTHGGSGLLAVYNADQKSVIKAFGSMEKDALYLFFVSSVQGKEGVNGYMPMQYQSGFIYDNTNAVTVAHELAHGAFNLAHTFSTEKFIAAQGASDNLLDYKGGDQLWKHQWKLVNNPQSMFLKFLQDEAEAEMYTTDEVKTLLETIHNANKSITVNVPEVVKFRDIIDDVHIDSLANVEPNLSRESFLSAFTHEQTLEKVENLREIAIADTAAYLPTDKKPILLANKAEVTINGKLYKLTINGYSMTEKIYVSYIAEDIVNDEHKLIFFNAAKVNSDEKREYQKKIDLTDLKNIRKAFDIIVHTEDGYGTAAELKKYLNIKGKFDLSGSPTISNDGITLRLKRKYNNSNITIGELTVDDDAAVKLITVELRKGDNCAEDNTILPKSEKSRICAGTYTFELNTIDNTAAPQHRYKSLRLKTKNTKTGGKRDGILVHTGWSYDFTEGCILTMNHENVQAVVNNPQNYVKYITDSIASIATWDSGQKTKVTFKKDQGGILKGAKITLKGFTGDNSYNGTFTVTQIIDKKNIVIDNAFKTANSQKATFSYCDKLDGVNWNNSAPTTMSLYEYVEKNVPNGKDKGKIIITDEDVPIAQSSSTKDVKKAEPTKEKSFLETAIDVLNEIIDVILEQI
ncbi:hypothetical protein AGMMS4957_14690 [Bacteroidia bacterium]|nr:hypothetical protein AGMMS4957_14690 [Bacteroidia bacterium]